MKKNLFFFHLFYLGSKAVLEYKDPVIDDPKQRRPDITLAKSWLNWAPHVNFSIISIKNMIEFFF
jgi:UDP-glucuronate decarboxylase